MSAASDQKSCEDIAVASLLLQTDLSGVNIVHFDNDAQASATSINRIVVQAMPRTVHTYGKDASVPVLLSCLVKVTAYLAENNPTLLDTYVAAIQAAFTGTSPPASIVTLATTLFGTARGFRWFWSDEGERVDTDNERQASQTWQAIFGSGITF